MEKKVFVVRSTTNVVDVETRKTVSSIVKEHIYQDYEDAKAELDGFDPKRWAVNSNHRVTEMWYPDGNDNARYFKAFKNDDGTADIYHTIKLFRTTLR